ncbi:MAG TPA: DNA-binding protein WhiA [Candidatus Limnocylindrales bacterium]|nr:DNA-binding protein WhiA [Candidatus Limnocylindrales bacterium]
MAPSDRDLVAAVRAEIAAVDPARPCDRAAEAAGLGPVVVTRESTIARLAVRLGATPVPTNPSSRLTRRFAFEPHVVTELDWPAAADHCRTAWLRGRFLARGSLSLSGGRTHLEFVVPVEDAPRLARRLADVGLPASWRVRRGQGVVTWKGSESVGTFLRRIGAGAALLEVEARAVARALRGELNRVLNAESANLARSVAAAGRQLGAIEQLASDGRLEQQPYTVRLVADARRQTPEASLADIAARLNLTRSAVQRALERLERLALHDDAGIGRRTARRRSSARGSGATRGAAARAVRPEPAGRAGPAWGPPLP